MKKQEKAESPIARVVEGKLTLLPPSPGLCQVCAAEHEPHMAHDPTSLYYQMAFHQLHGRMPTWRDAIDHLPPDQQAHWLEVLAEEGLDPDAPGGRKKLGGGG